MALGSMRLNEKRKRNGQVLIKCQNKFRKVINQWIFCGEKPLIQCDIGATSFLLMLFGTELRKFFNRGNTQILTIIDNLINLTLKPNGNCLNWTKRNRVLTTKQAHPVQYRNATAITFQIELNSFTPIQKKTFLSSISSNMPPRLSKQILEPL